VAQQELASMDSESKTILQSYTNGVNANLPHYADMIDMWRNIRYHPMRWDAGEIQSSAIGILTLTP
jgi:acyl-homoserine lactone acylase PvdQ